MQRLILQRTDDKKREENPNLPYFRLSIPPENEGGIWREVAAFWKSKNGSGYSGKTKDGVSIEFKVEGVTEINPDAIPF